MKAALSLDLDNKWSYMKTHGDARWRSYPSYIDTLVPEVLDVLSALGARITFFVVGQDVAFQPNRSVFASIAALGHEIGNHSYYHEPWMDRRAATELDDELARAEAAIGEATGERPIGFRGPGFVRSPLILETLVRRGYRYDASSLPTFIGPLARAYYFRSSRLTRDALREREGLFGSFTDGFRPNRRSMESIGGAAIAEIPVTTMPGVRLPIHLSYVLYIATVSPRLALAYFRLALILCRMTGTEPSILLHPLDFLTARECPELAFFPAMRLDGAVKRGVLVDALRLLRAHFTIVRLRDLLPV